MKVLIWIHNKEAEANKITEYFFTRPYHDRHDEWIQVQITQEEFAQLRDKDNKPSKGEMPDIVQKHQTITGGEFNEWWNKLTKEEQITITEYYDR